MYRDAKDVQHEVVVVTHVHHEDEPPYYTIRLHDSERSTFRERLRLPPKHRRNSLAGRGPAHHDVFHLQYVENHFWCLIAYGVVANVS